MGRIIGMMEAGWSSRREARQLGHSDCVVRCWDQRIREMSFTQRPVSGGSQQTSRREKSTTSFDISSDDNRVRVWRLRDERLNPAFDLHSFHRV
ncbi:transposable element Tcb2 transposase [Trichonephila clavipes]|nr:transposable element Tcb2 transposase [Trichonephila clavipes]